MSDRVMQFRVGVVVLATAIIAGIRERSRSQKSPSAPAFIAPVTLCMLPLRSAYQSLPRIRVLITSLGFSRVQSESTTTWSRSAFAGSPPFGSITMEP